jgi:hypothetical protein
MKKLLAIPYTFTVLNWASVAGLYYFLKKKDRARDVWLQHQTPAPQSQESTAS